MSPQNPPNRSRGRILVAEDDASLRRLLEMRLGVDGYEVRAAADGVEALELAREWVPDLAVVDVMMPRMSGLSLCRELRKGTATRSLPVILLTARVFDSDIQETMELGGIHFMNKPFNAHQLNASIRELMAQPQDIEAEGTARKERTPRP